MQAAILRSAKTQRAVWQGVFSVCLIALGSGRATRVEAAELTLTLEPPAVYVLEAPYDAKVATIAKAGSRALPTAADLGSGVVVTRLSSPLIDEEMKRLRISYHEMNAALYRQHFYDHRDANDVAPWDTKATDLSSTTEEAVGRIARESGKCSATRDGRPIKEAAAGPLSTIQQLSRSPVPQGAGRDLVGEAQRLVAGRGAGPYLRDRPRRVLMDHCIATLKASLLASQTFSPRGVPLVRVDPYRQQEMEINHRSPPEGVPDREPVMLPRLASGAPTAIRSMIEYWELSDELGVYTAHDSASLGAAAAPPFAAPGTRASALLARLRAAEGHANQIQEFWKKHDDFHRIAAAEAKKFYTSEPPPKQNASEEAMRGLIPPAHVEGRQMAYDKAYQEGKEKSELELRSKFLPLAKFAAPRDVNLAAGYARLINELKYKSTPLPTDDSGDKFVADYLEYVRSSYDVRFDSATFPEFVEDRVSASLGRHRLFELSVPLDLDATLEFAQRRPNKFLEAFRSQELTAAASLTRTMSRYRPETFYRVVEEVRAVRAARIELDQAQARIADSIRRDKDAAREAYRRLQEISGDGGLVAPVPGRVVAVHAVEDAHVASRTPLLSVSPFHQYQARSCGTHIADRLLQLGLMLDMGLDDFARHPAIGPVIEQHAAEWNAHLRQALQRVTFRLVVERAADIPCADGGRSWLLSVRAAETLPVVRLTLAEGDLQRLVVVLRKLEWRHFVDEGDLVFAVDGEVLDPAAPVRFVLK